MEDLSTRISPGYYSWSFSVIKWSQSRVYITEALDEPSVLMPIMDLLSKFQVWFSKAPFTSA